MKPQVGVIHELPLPVVSSISHLMNHAQIQQRLKINLARNYSSKPTSLPGAIAVLAMRETQPTPLIPQPLAARDRKVAYLHLVDRVKIVSDRVLLREVEIELIRSEFRQLAP